MQQLLVTSLAQLFHVRPLFLGLSAKEMLGLDGGHWDWRCVGGFGVMNVLEVSLIVPKRYNHKVSISQTDDDCY